MQRSLAFYPSFYQLVADAVGQTHETGILIRRLRVSPQSELNMTQDIVLQRSCGFGGFGRTRAAINVSPPFLAFSIIDAIRKHLPYCIETAAGDQQVRRDAT